MTAIAFRTRIAWPLVLAVALAAGCTAERNTNVGPQPPAPPAPDAGTPPATPPVDPNKTAADNTFDQGKDIFRHDTFGDQAFWTDVLHIDQAVAGCPTCGIPGGVTPATALQVGLKVDIDALTPDIVAAVTGPNRAAVLADPNTTLLLISKKAVLGVEPTADGKVGITCALCHSTVDNAGAAAPVSLPGVGHRLDGWPNRDLDVGTIVGLSPNISAVTALLNKGGGTLTNQNVLDVLHSWGPGKFDAELFLDGKAFNPAPNPPGSLQITANGSSAATLIPAAFGLKGVNLHTYTGWGSITQWNAFVAVLEMHGQGNYTDARLNDPKFPVAVANNFFRVAVPPAQDQVSSKLGALEFYQLALDTPAGQAGLDPAKVQAGKDLFNGPAKCATCHVPPLFTDAGWNMHTGAEIGVDDFQASRTPNPTPVYRTTPLRGVFARANQFVTNPAAKGRYYHDGRFATLDDVVAHYNTTMSLALSTTDQANLVEYLKSL